MELTQHDFLEEQVAAPMRESYCTFEEEMNNHDAFFFPHGWSFNNNNLTSFDSSSSSSNTQNPDFAPTNSSLLNLIYSSPIPQEQSHEFTYSLLSPYNHCTNNTPQPHPASFLDHNALPQYHSLLPIMQTPDDCIINDTNNMPYVEDPDFGLLYDVISVLQDNNNAAGWTNSTSTEEQTASDPNMVAPTAVYCEDEKKIKIKKGNNNGPSKNLMAERRRRKRLNDRLSMLRSIVPKISKMDRTSILGDTIDYMKELLEKINKLREEEKIDETLNRMKFIDTLKEPKPNATQMRNPPKFEVERRKEDTQVEICCAAKPGLLLSTIGTLEALGLDIQQCVISCFNDFSLQASCSEEAEHQAIINSEELKQALFRNAGYGGRCL